MSFTYSRNNPASFVAAIFLAAILCSAAGAQTKAFAGEASTPSATAQVAPRTQTNDNGDAGDSVISPDDVIEVYALDVPELSRQYRVSPTGKVVLPLLPDALPASGMTPADFSEELATQLKGRGLVTNPHIVVTIISSRLKSVAITGAVKMPQIYPVFGKTTLLDILSQAQGLADDASNVAIISRGSAGEQATGETTQSVDIKKLLQDADPKDNVDIYPGDRVTVPHAGIVYVVGAVNKPGGFMLKTTNGMTVLQALAMAEDVKLDSVKSKAVIIRPDPNAPEGHEQLPVNLNLVLQGKQPDVVMLADDILYVPESASKRAFRNIGQAALQAATLAVVYRP
jgi:polysaccharide export outer membrane protein